MKKIFLIFALAFSFTTFAQQKITIEKENVIYEFSIVEREATHHDQIFYEIKENGAIKAAGRIPFEESREYGFIRFESIKVENPNEYEEVIYIKLKSFNVYAFYLNNNTLRSKRSIYNRKKGTLDIIPLYQEIPSNYGF